MKVSPNGLELIKHFEGCRLEAYPDPATGGKPWTIGYGSTKNVEPDLVIDQPEAEHRLQVDVDEKAFGVEKIAENCSQEQFDALVSFAFNLGLIALERSTLLKLHNEGKYRDVPEQFNRWVRANGAVMSGLVKRRKAESLLYQGKDWTKDE